MFETVSIKHHTWNCLVGGSSHGVSSPKLCGMGCVLDDFHILTARHCWTGISDKWDWPVALAFGTLFRCTIAAEFPDDDIAVLRISEQIDNRPAQRPNSYPSLSRKPISWGTSLGFMSRLRLPKENGNMTSYAYLAAGVVSILLPNGTDAHRFALTNALVQKGFSGSAAFRPDGSIVGVIVECFTFFIDPENQLIPPHQLPVVSPISHLIGQLDAVIASKPKA